jgi:UDP-N-acetylmuramate dehydrogenase
MTAPTPPTTLDVQHDVSLRTFNTFGVPARARVMVRVTSDADVRRVLDHPQLGRMQPWVLGGGSNVLLSRDVQALVIKVDVRGLRVLAQTADATIVEAGAGEPWHDVVAWTLQQGWGGLENLALIPGSTGAAPVQNIGAYGVELCERFESLDAVDLVTGRSVTLDAQACRFGYRDSVFKQALAGKSLITRVRLRLPKPWQPALGYLDLQRKVQETGQPTPSAQTIFDWVCAIRRHKLPDPAVIGNAGSFFKNPVVNQAQCHDIVSRDPNIVHYALADGLFKLAAASMIDACGWKGKAIGEAAVSDKHSLVLVNRGRASGAEIVTLARAIQESVYGRFGIRLEPEPVII